MTKLFRHWWQPCLLGLLVGIPAGIALEYQRRVYNDAVMEAMAREFEAKGMSPPLMIDFLHPWVVPILTAIIFSFLALLIYVLVIRIRRVLQKSAASLVTILIVLMLAHPSCSTRRSDQTRQQAANQAGKLTLSLGMSHKAALEIIRECGGKDITANLAVVGPNHEWPLSGLYWNLEQYNSILEIAEKDGIIVGIWYWTVADFSESKNHREESRKSLKSLTFEKQTRTLKTQAL